MARDPSWVDSHNAALREQGFEEFRASPAGLRAELVSLRAELEATADQRRRAREIVQDVAMMQPLRWVVDEAGMMDEARCIFCCRYAAYDSAIDAHAFPHSEGCTSKRAKALVREWGAS